MTNFYTVADSLNQWLRDQGLLPNGQNMFYGHQVNASAIGVFTKHLNIRAERNGIFIRARYFEPPKAEEDAKHAAERQAQQTTLRALHGRIKQANPVNIVIEDVRNDRGHGYPGFRVLFQNQQAYSAADLVRLFQSVHPALIAFDPNYVVRTQPSRRP